MKEYKWSEQCSVVYGQSCWGPEELQKITQQLQSNLQEQHHISSELICMIGAQAVEGVKKVQEGCLGFYYGHAEAQAI